MLYICHTCIVYMKKDLLKWIFNKPIYSLSYSVCIKKNRHTYVIHMLYIYGVHEKGPVKMDFQEANLLLVLYSVHQKIHICHTYVTHMLYIYGVHEKGKRTC